MSSAVPSSSQVAALPIGSGGSNATKKQLNDINVSLSMMAVQTLADQKYDPPVPTPIRPALIKEAFCSMASVEMVPMAVATVGAVLAIYGLF